MFCTLIATLLFLLPLISRHHTSVAGLNTNSKVDEILSFLTTNGKRHLSIVTLDTQDKNVTALQKQFMMISKKANTFTRRIVTNGDETDPVSNIKEKLDFYKDSLVILASTQDVGKWDLYFDLLTMVETMSATLILCDPISINEKNDFSYFISY